MPAPSMEACRAFVKEGTRLRTLPLLPELRFHLGGDVTALWHATQAFFARAGAPRSPEPGAELAPIPFWAYAWAGGQALARYLMDDPARVRGKAVLDVASGGGVVAVAAARAGAARVLAVDVDMLAAATCALNAEENGVTVEPRVGSAMDLDAGDFDLITAGDVFYDATMTQGITAWLSRLARQKPVLTGDPGRKYTPGRGLTELARYPMPTSVEVEGKGRKVGVVYRVTA